MSRILFVWECGGGYGHLTRYKGLIKSLIGLDHEVFFVARNLRSAEVVYGDMDVQLRKAPLPRRDQKAWKIRPDSYLDVIFNQCCDSQEGLLSRLKSWLAIYEEINPDLIIIDHGPTAQLAYRVYAKSSAGTSANFSAKAKCIVSGNSFCIPPTEGEILPFWNEDELTRENLDARDQTLLESYLNPCLKVLNGLRLESCLDIFDLPQWLFGYSQLDHYQKAIRKEKFIGLESPDKGIAADWPKAKGPKVFIYSEKHPLLPVVINYLASLKWPVIAVFKQSARELGARLKQDSIHVSEELLDIDQVASECDFAITNASQSTNISFLSKGKPLLMMPAHVEHAMAAKIIEGKNSGINLNNAKTKTEIKSALETLGNTGSDIHKQAKAFAEALDQQKLTDVNEFMLSETLAHLSELKKH